MCRYSHSLLIYLACAIIRTNMKEPIIGKIELLDTEYAQLLDLEIDKQKYLEDRTVPSRSKTVLTRLKVEIAATFLVMLLIAEFFAFQLVNYQPSQANDDVTTQLGARLILEMQRQQLREFNQNSSCP